MNSVQPIMYDKIDRVTLTRIRENTIREIEKAIDISVYLPLNDIFCHGVTPVVHQELRSNVEHE